MIEVHMAASGSTPARTALPLAHCMFVIHSVDPYCYELGQIFALPNGFKYRHRYDERWVDASVRDNLDAVAGQDVLVVFWNSETKKLLPLRWGKIENAQKVGRIHYFEYRLLEFVAYKNDAAQRQAQINAFNETFQGFHPDIIGYGETGFRASVLSSEAGLSMLRADYDNLTNWGNVLDEAARASIFRGFEFLKIIDLQESGRKLNPIEGRYEIRSNRTYTLRVFQIIPNFQDSTIRPHDIELNAFAEQIQILRRRQSAVGKYDILTFIFRPSRLRPADQTALELVPVHDGLPQAQFQRLYIPVRMKADKAQSVARGVGVLAGIALVFLPLFFGVQDRPLTGYLGLMLFILSLTGGDGIRSIIEPFRNRKY
jgi:hypothetical protein